MELEKAQRLFRFEEEMLVTLIAELKILTSDERATVKTLNEFSEKAKRQTAKMRNSQREVVGCGGEVEVGKVERKLAKVTMEIRARIEKLNKSSENRNKTQLKLDRVKLPSFNGQIREYPRFKTNFERQVIPKLIRSQYHMY